MAKTNEDKKDDQAKLPPTWMVEDAAGNDIWVEEVDFGAPEIQVTVRPFDPAETPCVGLKMEQARDLGLWLLERAKANEAKK